MSYISKYYLQLEEPWSISHPYGYDNSNEEDCGGSNNLCCGECIWLEVDWNKRIAKCRKGKFKHD